MRSIFKSSPSLYATDSTKNGSVLTVRNIQDTGPQFSDPKTAHLLGELAQAKIRNYLHCVLVILTFAAYRIDYSIGLNWVIYTSIASFVSAFSLYFWAYGIQHKFLSYKTRLLQRGASILSDNLFITLVLFIGGQSTAGVWALYIWISIGYGVRYGVQYLQANVFVSVIAFSVATYFSPFWYSCPRAGVRIGGRSRSACGVRGEIVG